MSRDRSRTQERSGSPATDADGATDVDLGLEEEEVAPASEQRGGRTGGLRDRVASRATRFFAPRRFLLALALSVGGLLGANAVVPLPGAGLVGVLFAAFVFGLVVEERRYAEATLAGALAVGASFLLDYAVIAVLGGLGLSLGLVGAGLGAAAGAVGTYFGRDLRHGLTRDVP